MRKLIFSLTALGLISSSTMAVTSCFSFTQRLPGVEANASDCFDQNWKNRGTENWEENQWVTSYWMMMAMNMLPKEKFTNVADFQAMDNKTSDELANLFSTDENDQDWTKLFHNKFTFLMTTYDSINLDVILKMQQKKLLDKEPGTYLFLNLPEINIDDIQNEPEIDFQFLFMIKDAEGKITGNSKNDWFYWFDYQNINHTRWEHQYFLNLSKQIGYNRVVTNYLLAF